MKTTMMPLRLVAAALLAAGTVPVQAADFGSGGASIEAGVGKHATQMAGLGLVWDWDFERMRRNAELTAHTELMLNRWRFHAIGGGHSELTQAVLLPSLRMRLERGASPVFIELGIGASWMDRNFETPERRFGSRWNFYDMLGVGYTFGGAGGRHEVGLRWSHVSNAGLKQPNPGQDFLQLRYVQRF